MRKTVSDQIVERLHAWGVRRVFGYPGDGINGVMGALDRQREQVRFVPAAHEEIAAFMAVGHAKFTGEVGVCIATSGPGAIHLLNGLYDAKADHQPVVAILGQQARSALGSEYQQEVDLVSLFKDVAGEFVQMATTPAQVRHLVDRAVRIARDQRTVTCIVLPSDLQRESAVEEPPRQHGTTHSGIGSAPALGVPDVAQLKAAAEVLNAGRKVAILAGAGALQSGAELVEVANCLGAGVAKALLGKAAVPDDLPFVTGAIGLIGTEASWELMQGCDTLLMVGTTFPYTEFLPKEGQARAVQIDIDPRRLGLRYPTEVNLVGDSRAVLQALLPLLQPKPDRAWREQVEASVRQGAKLQQERGQVEAKPINPQRVFQELSPRLPEDAIVCWDSGTVAAWYARDVQLRGRMMGSGSGGLSSMGCAVPYALAGKLAHPGRPVVALVGDGAMQMLGINGLIHIARDWRQWADPRLVVLVLNNGDLNMVTWEQRATEGNRRFDASQQVPAFSYAEYGRMLGLRGVRIDRANLVGLAWEEAFNADRPVVLEMVTDATVLPIPPHVNREQVQHTAKAVLQGDTQALDVVKQTARQLWAGLTGKKSPTP